MLNSQTSKHLRLFLMAKPNLVSKWELISGSFNRLINKYFFIWNKMKLNAKYFNMVYGKIGDKKDKQFY